MFERYTEKARRVVYFARHEASRSGTSHVEVDHLLLGLLREDKELLDGLLKGEQRERLALYEEVQALRTPAAPHSTSMELLLSHSSKRVLAYAAEESARFGHNHIGCTHLLLATLREPSLALDVLHRHGLELEDLQTKFAGSHEGGSPSIPATPHLSGSAAVLITLQQQFHPLTSRLSPEIESALVFHLP